jgi:hypothetical protein
LTLGFVMVTGSVPENTPDVLIMEHCADGVDITIVMLKGGGNGGTSGAHSIAWKEPEGMEWAEDRLYPAASEDRVIRWEGAEGLPLESFARRVSQMLIWARSSPGSVGPGVCAAPKQLTRERANQKKPPSCPKNVHHYDYFHFVSTDCTIHQKPWNSV